jgi:predicted O-methyltransferase YrrM
MSLRRAMTAAVLGAQNRIGHLQLRSHADLLASVPKNAIPPVWRDLWYLYRRVRERRPQIVLEFGSGCSTAVIAAALSENGGGKIYSLESDAAWARVSAGYITPALAAHCEIIHAPAVASEHCGTAVWRHAVVPDVAPDFVYLDGPPLTDERPIAVDVLDIEPRLRPGTLLVTDGRVRNFRYLQQHLAKPWRFAWHPLAHRGVGELGPQ